VDGETEIQVNPLESNIVRRQMRLGDGTKWPYRHAVTYRTDADVDVNVSVYDCLAAPSLTSDMTDRT